MMEYGTNESWIWHSPTEELRFQVSQNGKPILCRVTRECISDHCGKQARSPQVCHHQQTRIGSRWWP